MLHPSLPVSTSLICITAKLSHLNSTTKITEKGISESQSEEVKQVTGYPLVWTQTAQNRSIQLSISYSILEVLTVGLKISSWETMKPEDILHPSCSAHQNFLLQPESLHTHWSLHGRLLVNGNPPGSHSKLILVCDQHPEPDFANHGKQSEGDISNSSFAGLNTEKKPLRA